jgi:serine protease Do
MQILNALLIAGGLAAVPASVAAGPTMNSEHVEFSAGKARLGVYVMSLTPELRKHFGAGEDRGVMVARVEPMSAAARAGLMPGDVVTEVGSRPVADASDVISALSSVPKDGKVTLAVVRDGKKLELSATLTAAPMSWADPFFSTDWLHDFFQQFDAGARHSTST